MLKLNLGSADKLMEGAENIDIRPIAGTIQKDVRDLDYDENSVDEIHAIDVLEHISHNETLATLIHWISLLKPGGKLYIQCPCLPMIAAYMFSSNDPKIIEQSIKLLYGNQDYPENTHRTAVHPILLKHYLTLDMGIPEENIQFGTDFGTNIRVIIIKPDAQSIKD